jgi:hypothetical protein
VRRYGPAIAGAYTQEAWPQTVVLDAIEFGWTNPPALAARTDRRHFSGFRFGMWLAAVASDYLAVNGSRGCGGPRGSS